MKLLISGNGRKMNFFNSFVIGYVSCLLIQIELFFLMTLGHTQHSSLPEADVLAGMCHLLVLLNSTNTLLHFFLLLILSFYGYCNVCIPL